MKGLIFKDILCLKKQFVVFCYVLIGVLAVSVMFVLSVGSGNLADAKTVILAENQMEPEDIKNMSCIALVMFMILPLACVGDTLNTYEQDGNAGFFRIASTFPIPLHKRILSRFLSVLTVLGNAVTILLCPEIYDPAYYISLGMEKRLLLLLPVFGMVSGLTVSFAAFGEEGGWRAYMMPKLTKLFEGKPAGEIWALIIGGIIWGLWHAPLTCIGHNFGTDYPGFPYLGILMMCISCILVGILLTYVTKKSGSVWPAAIMHAVNNTGPSILNGYINYEKVSTLKGMLLPFAGQIMVMVLIIGILMLVSGRKPDTGIKEENQTE